MTPDYNRTPLGLINLVTVPRFTWRDRVLDALDYWVPVAVRFVLLSGFAYLFLHAP